MTRNMRMTKMSFVMMLSALVFIGAGCGGPERPAIVPVDQANNDLGAVAEDAGSASNAEDPGEGMEMEEGTPEEHGEAMEGDTNDNNETTMEGNFEVPTAFPGVLPDAELKGKQVRLKTTKGEIVFDVYADEAPKASSNMVALARSGYYDGLTFHRVVPGFVIQGGDPTGTGSGGPGYQFEDETVTLDYEAGIVAMANAGPNTNGSQFFIVLEDQPGLPKLYTVFGRVTSGMDVVKQIVKGDVMSEVLVEDK